MNGPADSALIGLVEALLFVSEKPLVVADLAEFLTDNGAEKIEAVLGLLQERYEDLDGGLRLVEVAGGYRLATRPSLGPAVKEFFRFKNRQKLSRAALETLAIVAYKQPVTHPEIQEIRGVASDSALKTLLERRLLRIAGRKETVGKPVLYGTTRDFLEYFGLASLEALPPVEEFDALLGEDLHLSMEGTLATPEAPGLPAALTSDTDPSLAPGPAPVMPLKESGA